MAVVAFLRQSDLDGDAEQMERQSNGHAITSFRRMMANRLPRSLLQAVLLTRISAGENSLTSKIYPVNGYIAKKKIGYMRSPNRQTKYR